MPPSTIANFAEKRRSNSFVGREFQHISEEEEVVEAAAEVAAGLGRIGQKPIGSQMLAILR